MTRHLLAGIICTVLALATTVAQAQFSSISLEASQNVTDFYFKDSNGNPDKNYTPSLSFGYALGYRYGMANGLMIGAKVGYRKAGATYVYDAINYSWNMDYLEFRINFGYSYFFKKWGFHAKVQPYVSYLLSANQTLNNEDLNIKNSGDIISYDYGFFVSPGFSYAISDKFRVNLDYNYMLGLANLEKNQAQTSNNTLMGVTLGFSFKFVDAASGFNQNQQKRNKGGADKN